MQSFKSHLGAVIPLAIVFAMAGFSYAVSTQDPENSAGSNLPRTVVGTNTPLTFANPFFQNGTDRDLGDAVAGSNLVRLIRAKGGVAPYSFTAGTVPDALKLQANGILSGVLNGAINGSNNPIRTMRFLVTVTDSSAFALGSQNTHSEFFRLTIVSTTTFRFATSALADGTQYQSYSDRLATINGALPIKYTVSGVKLNGVATATGTLSDVGLGVATDGSVFGSPLVSGTVTFLATATDNTNNAARSRTGITVGQQYTLTIAANKLVSTAVSASMITVKSGFGGSRDSISYKGIANIEGKAPAALAGSAVALQIGTFATTTAQFDAKGGAVAATTTFKLLKTGAFSAMVRKTTIGLGLPTVPPPTVDLPVQVMIGNLLLSSEILRFSVKSNGSGGATLTYKASSLNDLGGTFQLTSVKGKDDSAAIGDSWMVGFLDRVPTNTSYFTISKTEVAIGTTFDVTSSSVKNVNGKISFKGFRGAPAEIISFSADLVKGKGTYVTSVIPTAMTGIPISAQGGTGAFSTRISYFDSSNNVVSGGIGGLTILPKSSTMWSSQR